LAKTNNIYAQQTPLIPFEGCISYQDMVKSKASGGVTYRSTKLFFKQGFYKAEIMANTTKNLEIYAGKDTLFSFPLPLGKYIWWADVRESKDTILNFEITENVADIAGHKCNLLKITSKQLNINYYYSSKIYIDPQPFSKHALRHFGFCLEKTKGALPLKVIYEYPKHTIEMQALNIEKQKYESWHFQVPRDKILVPNKF
jgi:hypothetical protein